MADNISLIGPMGAGKSSIGKRLAQQLKQPFFDSDRLIEEKTGVAISTIFELEGEKGFRHRESKALSAILKDNENAIIATGGGIVLVEDNQRQLTEHSIVIYLQASVEAQINRTKHDKKRPLLQTEDRYSTLQKLAMARNPLYESLANITIDTSQQSIAKSLEQIIKELSKIGRIE
ncbi:MAG: shikimate kinase [Pseudomonadota bacterium]